MFISFLYSKWIYNIQAKITLSYIHPVTKRDYFNSAIWHTNQWQYNKHYSLGSDGSALIHDGGVGGELNIDAGESDDVIAGSGSGGLAVSSGGVAGSSGGAVVAVAEDVKG